MSYAIGGIAVVGLIALIIINSGSDADSSAYSASALSILNNNFNFGTISMANGDVSRVFEIKNQGSEPVKIKKVFSTCMCTTAVITDSQGKKYGKFGMPGHGLPSRTNIEVMPGETITIEATYDPNAHGPSGVGFIQRSIYLNTNSAKSPKLELKFQAIVTR